MSGNPVELLPHGYPFRLLDRVTEIDGSRAVGIKNVTGGEALSGSRPLDLLPDVLLIEALAQLSGLVMNHGKDGAKAAVLAQIKSASFSRQARAGDTIRLVSEAEASFGGLASFSVAAYCDDVLIAEGKLVLAEAVL